ncbi:hypothetical protein LguiA_021304 [Lonicera macranthoides]
MDAQEQFFQNQIKSLQESRDDMENDFERIQQEERGKLRFLKNDHQSEDPKHQWPSANEMVSKMAQYDEPPETRTMPTRSSFKNTFLKNDHQSEDPKHQWPSANELVSKMAQYDEPPETRTMPTRSTLILPTAVVLLFFRSSPFLSLAPLLPPLLLFPAPTLSPN